MSNENQLRAASALFGRNNKQTSTHIASLASALLLHSKKKNVKSVAGSDLVQTKKKVMLRVKKTN